MKTVIRFAALTSAFAIAMTGTVSAYAASLVSQEPILLAYRSGDFSEEWRLADPDGGESSERLRHRILSRRRMQSTAGDSNKRERPSRRKLQSRVNRARTTRVRESRGRDTQRAQRGIFRSKRATDTFRQDATTNNNSVRARLLRSRQRGISLSKVNRDQRKNLHKPRVRLRERDLSKSSQVQD